LSGDLPYRILQAYERKEASRRQLTLRFAVSLEAARKIRRKQRQSGRMELVPSGTEGFYLQQYSLDLAPSKRLGRSSKRCCDQQKPSSKPSQNCSQITPDNASAWFKERWSGYSSALASRPMRWLALLDIVAIPLGNLDDVGARSFDDRLTAEARVQLDASGRLHAV
jgi:hypothetical protein